MIVVMSGHAINWVRGQEHNYFLLQDRKTEQPEEPTQQGLKNGEEKGGTISETVTDYLTAWFVTLPPTGSRPSINVQSD